MRKLWPILFCMLLLMWTQSVRADQLSQIDAAAHIERTLVRPGDSVDIAIQIDVADGYKLQSAQPLEANLVALTVTSPGAPGVTLGQVKFPQHLEKKVDKSLSELEKLAIYQGRIYVLATLNVAKDAALGERTVTLAIRSQACDDTSCLPPRTTRLNVSFSVGQEGSMAVAPAEIFTAARNQKFLATKTASPETSETKPAPTTTTTAPLTANLLSDDDQLALIAQRDYAPHNSQQYEFWQIALMALAGGAILNIMPCVLPVIPLKVLSLVQQAHGKRSRAITHALIFSLGVVSLFVLLALLLRTFGLFYGQQFQSTAFLIGIAYFVLALALSMLGIWTINPPQAVYAADSNVSTASHGYTRSFMNGLLATVLATPCSAPFLGPVLAWALLQPAWVTVLALALVGVGMSIPYIILAAFPAGLDKLPRTGRWSELLKQALGIIMIGVAVYLMTLVPNVGYWPYVLLGAVLIGLICWGWGQLPTYNMTRTRIWSIRAVVILLGLLLAWPLWSMGKQSGSIWSPGKADSIWQPFNIALLDAALKDGRPVVIDWTADWCINCRALEKLVLNTADVQAAFRAENALLLKADLTQDNPPADALNRKLGGQSIPVLAIFSPSRPTKPVVLRDSYTKQRVIDEVRAAQ